MSLTLGRTARYLAVLSLFLFSALLPGCGLWTTAPKPRLVVLLVIDQFPAGYLERFSGRFGEDGFKRLLREGAVFTSCYYSYAVTETAPGHATLATGTTPDRHGIIGNNVVDEATGQVVAAVHDPGSPTVGGSPESGPVSPRRLLLPTLAARMGAQLGDGSKQFSVAIKDRSANFMLGQAGDAAYWYDMLSGRFVTSEYYRAELPEWVSRFNREQGADRFYGDAWTEGGTVYSPLTSASGQPDPEFYGSVIRSPHGNTLVMDFVRELIRTQELGKDEVTDFLAIGFSSNDYAGHKWGPYSDEIASMTGHTDRQIAELLVLLDEAAGEGNWVLAFSSDHGVAPSVEQAKALGLPGLGFASQEVRDAVDRALSARWGEGPWLLEQGYRTHLVFDRAVLERTGVTVNEAARVAGRAVTRVEGVRGYFAAASNNLSPELADRYRLSYFPGRSPDVDILPEEYAIRDPWADAGQHGSPYDYDRHVPLIFFGLGVRPGVYDEPVSPADLAPTLARVAGIAPLPDATGKVLEQVFSGKGGEKVTWDLR